MLHLLRDKVLLGNCDLLVFGVAGKTDDFHPVEKRRRDVQRVRRGYEHHVREIVFDFDVVVDKGVVLLGIEHFQQRG